MADRIQLRRDTAANWSSANPILAQGEIGVNLDTNTFKIGDGVTAWNILPYYTDGSGETNTASNLGTGEHIFNSKIGVDLQFKTLKATGTSTLSSDGTSVTINSITNTDDLSEGSANLYFTDSRVDNNSNVTDNTSARHTHSNKALLDTYNQSNTDIADAVSKKHTHANQTVLDNITAPFTIANQTKLNGIADGAEVNVQSDWNETDINSDAYIKNKPSASSGDMTKAVYDVDNNGIVDKAEIVTGSQADDIANNTISRHDAVTVVDSTNIDLGLSGQEITADLKNTSVTPGNYEHADITVDSKGRITAASNGVMPVFGTEYSTAVDSSESSTTSTSWQEKLSHTTTSLPVGTYRIGWYFEWRRNSARNDFESRVQINNSITIMNHNQESKDGSSWNNVCGFYHHTISSPQTLQIDIDYTGETTSNRSYIREVRIEVWRVA